MNTHNNKLIYPELSYKIVGILFKVHNELGNKYQEKYYQRAIEIELKNQNIKFVKEIPVDLEYEKEKIGKYFLDFLIDDKVVLEIKTIPRLRPRDFKQVLAYLKSINLKLGIIANFHSEQLTFHRILNANL
jgi:GxxExxY protein